MNNRKLRRNLTRYIDAGFPIIYINTYEEEKVDELIVSCGLDRKVYEWNGINGFIDFRTKAPQFEDCPLEKMLNLLKLEGMLDRKTIVLKDIAVYLENTKIVSMLKGLARMICGGVDATIVKNTMTMASFLLPPRVWISAARWHLT